LHYWRKENPRKRSAQSRRYYQAHKKRIQARNDDRRKERLDYLRAWQREHPNYQSRWQQENSGKCIIYAARRRTRKAKVANTLTQEQIDFEMNIAQTIWPDEELHIHHIVPISKKGNHSWGNIMAIPVSLNHSIGNKLPEEVYRQKELF